jgi:hypothetical protein
MFFGFVILKLGPRACTFCVQDHKKTDLGFRPRRQRAMPEARNSAREMGRF